MGLSSTNPHILGRNQRFSARVESTAGTQIKPVDGSGLKVETTTMAHTIAREDWNCPGDFRDAPERITGKSQNTWGVETWLIPNSTVANVPQASALLTAGFGANNSGAGSQWIYSLTSVQTFPTLSLYREWEGEFTEAMWGAWVDEIKITASGGTPPKLSVNGRAMRYALTGRSTLNGAIVADATMIAQAVDDNKFDVGSIVQIDADTNGGAGYKIVTNNTAAGSFELETTVSADNLDAVVPFLAETASFVGSPVPGVYGSIQLHDGSSLQTLKITGFEASIANNIDAFEDESFVQHVEDATPNWRQITGTITCRARRDHIVHFANVKAFTVRDLVVIMGQSGSPGWQVDIDYAEVEFPELQVPADTYATFQLPFKAMPSSTGNDAITLTQKTI